MRSFFGNRQWITSCTGIEARISAGQESDYRLCSVAIQGDQLSILSKEVISGGQLNEKIRRAGPIAVTITGRGVLIKKIARIEALSPEVLNEVFPNLKTEEFYLQVFTSGENSYIAVIRREIADGILKHLTDNGLDLLSVSLGPFHAEHILSQLNCYGKEIVFDGHIVQLEEGTWSSYRFDAGLNARFPLKLGIEPVEERFILAYAAAFQLLMYNSLSPIAVENSPLNDQLSDYKEKQLFKSRFKVLLGSFCLMLLVNFLLFSIYDSENQELASQLNSTASSRGTVEQLAKAASRKEVLLKQLGWNKGISYAYLCDQIGQTLPASAQLNTIIINPEMPLSGSRKQLAPDAGKIHIEGLSTNLNEVNNWIFQLKDRSWVKDAMLSSYAPADEESLNKLMVVISY